MGEYPMKLVELINATAAEKKKVVAKYTLSKCLAEINKIDRAGDLLPVDDKTTQLRTLMVERAKELVSKL
jgi:hypothetical protein